MRLAARAHLAYESDDAALFLPYAGFVVRYDEARGLPRYTIHRLTPDQIQEGSRSPARRVSTYRVEEFEGGTHSATNLDYAGTGYDRGHLVPAGDFVWSQPLKTETFVYTNIAPFHPNLNRGPWANLEGKIRAEVLARGEEAFVITGVLFAAEQPYEIGPFGLDVPTHFYKILCFPRAAVMYAFLMDNMSGEYEGPLADFQVPVDFLERVTGEDFFDRFDDEAEDVMERAVVRLGRATTE